MKRGQSLWPLLAAWLVLLSTAVRAEDSIVVITRQDAPDIAFDRANLQDIFLKRIRVDESRAALVPLNLSPSHPLRTAFSLSLMGERPEAKQRYWSERYFHGITPPYSVNSQEAMLRFVSNTPGAVGYVLSCKVDGRVRVVAKLPIPADMQAQMRALCEQPEHDADGDTRGL